MSGDRRRFQAVVYRVFLVSCAMATVLGLLVIWGVTVEGAAGVFLVRLLGTCVVLALAAALTMSTTRLAAGRKPEDDES